MEIKNTFLLKINHLEAKKRNLILNNRNSTYYLGIQKKMIMADNGFMTSYTCISLGLHPGKNQIRSQEGDIITTVK